MAARPMVVQKATPRETFESLGKEFKWDKKVVEAILSEGIQDLEEFRFLFHEEKQTDDWLSKIKDLPNPSLEGARLRKAWHSVRLQATAREKDHSQAQIQDLDDPLGDEDLLDLKTSFWRRYKLSFPPEIHPSDSLISRVARECHKRMLMVTNLWLVKTLMFQVTSSRKRQKVGDMLYMDAPEEVAPATKDLSGYLSRLHTYLLALAIAGVRAIPGGADPSTERDLGADSTKVVQIPLDTLMAYYFRAVRAVQSKGGASALAWLEQQDIQERAHWVQSFRQSQKHLGVIVKETMQLRDAHWICET
ncbi:unnamed protein product [Effrenium voratum]|uniref:Uncharacterized protein n=1 Tax=Effrenium voratum TaxID=2562239 RepID=A0AA36N541_9DINO|nr:unnamed protein product [Effrenium voratum]